MARLMPSTQGPGVLIVDAGERSAVAACESLARAGYRVGTASSQWPAPAGWSRFSERRFPLPNPRAEPAEFATAAARIAAEHRYATVLPCSEGSLWAISSRREAFAGEDVRLGLPGEEVLARCTDKAELVARAHDAGLGAPETVVCSDPGEALTAAERFGYPAVLKPLRTVFEAGGETRHLASALVADRGTLEERLSQAGLPCLIQRREQGPVVSFAGVFAGGRLLAAACSRYLRTWPAEAGPVSFSRSFDPGAEALAAVSRLVGSLGWEGIFELEAIERGPGDYAVLDFNPRIYGSLALAVKAGAPLPAIWCDWLLDGRAADVAARPDVHYRWEDAELRNALHCLRAGEPGAAISILRPRRATAHAYFRWYDPLPLAVRVARPLNRLRRRLPGRA
jgi:predicted ATP-grasp superfamily ATP-dependent carboligase